MILVTHVAVLERSGTTIFVHVLKFSVLIDSTVQSITYYLFAYVLINTDKIIELPIQCIQWAEMQRSGKASLLRPGLNNVLEPIIGNPFRVTMATRVCFYISEMSC